ncbi:hypothetical protein [Mangrovihabitans endophyticus]|uniref:Ribulose 1,5-bisphosphate carboxylase large subunit n=1 Tax=Mangrovihabitans endophyticus TaxID=1751298 RepID=A0A8J3BXN2_9ACTN|nr:hypothetical protein [Mangrovihabitans endophyticus]GGK81172.1 hypothetical protein GCM10012284_13870 [Mangrovihabitans endophyticus]
MAFLPSPSALVELGRYAVGQAVETVASVATIPVRAAGLLGQAELIVNRITVTVDTAEALIRRIESITAAAEETVAEARAITAEATAVAGAAAGVVQRAEATADGATAVVRRAAAATDQAAGLLDAYADTLSKAAPLAQRFVEELSPDEVTAAIRMVDELPKLRTHLSEDVLPLLGKLDQVGPDLHALLEVTRDLHLAIAGLPGLRMLRRRGEERVDDDAAAGR